MVLASLLERSLGKPMGLSPRRLSRFERGGGDMMAEETGGEITGSPPATPIRIEPAMPSPSVRPSPETGTAQPPAASIHRIETVERMRIERIMTEPVAPAPAPMIAPMVEPHDPVASSLPRATGEAPTETPRARRSRRAAPQPPSIDPAPQPTPADPPAPATERVHVIEQHLHTLSREWARETRVERTREIVRAGESAARPARRAEPDAPPLPATRIRQERLRPAATPMPAPAADPVVEVHIGCVELRATMAAPPRAARPTARREAGLETYLRKRDGH